jgi:putative membrane protein (TIGR04086 family)
LAALAALFLVGGAWLLCRTGMALAYIDPLATTAAGAAVLGAAMLFGYLQRKKGLLNGVLLAAVLLAAVWGVSLAQGQAALSSQVSVKACVLLAAGAVGGYVGALLRARKRRIR